MAITYFGSASTPADNGTNTATTTAVTPPSSMLTGDLVILYAYQRGTATMSISSTGGQTWDSSISGINSSSATLAGRLFWCVFNGTWSADPSVLFSAGTNTNVVMHVFRPTSTAYSWALDSSAAQNTLGNFGASPSITFGFASTSHSSAVCLVIASTDDDNTWSTSGSGWSTLGSAQYRNTSGSDTSSSYAYIIQTAIGTPANVTKTEVTLGNDGGIVGDFCFYEFSTSVPNKIYQIKQAVNRASTY